MDLLEYERSIDNLVIIHKGGPKYAKAVTEFCNGLKIEDPNSNIKGVKTNKFGHSYIFEGTVRDGMTTAYVLMAVFNITLIQTSGTIESEMGSFILVSSDTWQELHIEEIENFTFMHLFSTMKSIRKLVLDGDIENIPHDTRLFSANSYETLEIHAKNYGKKSEDVIQNIIEYQRNLKYFKLEIKSGTVNLPIYGQNLPNLATLHYVAAGERFVDVDMKKIPTNVSSVTFESNSENGVEVKIENIGVILGPQMLKNLKNIILNNYDKKQKKKLAKIANRKGCHGAELNEHVYEIIKQH